MNMKVHKDGASTMETVNQEQLHNDAKRDFSLLV